MTMTFMDLRYVAVEFSDGAPFRLGLENRWAETETHGPPFVRAGTLWHENDDCFIGRLVEFSRMGI